MCWHIFLQRFCLTTTGPQSKGTGLVQVSYRGGLLTKMCWLPQVWPCYKHDKLCMCTSLLRCLSHIFKRSCPCKLCFKTAPGPWGLHRSCWGWSSPVGFWWDRNRRNVQQGIWTGIGWGWGARRVSWEPVQSRSIWKRSWYKEMGRQVEKGGKRDGE